MRGVRSRVEALERRGGDAADGHHDVWILSNGVYYKAASDVQVAEDEFEEDESVTVLGVGGLDYAEDI